MSQRQALLPTHTTMRVVEPLRCAYAERRPWRMPSAVLVRLPREVGDRQHKIADARPETRGDIVMAITELHGDMATVWAR